jgi:hypothetical protein
MSDSLLPDPPSAPDPKQNPRSRGGKRRSELLSPERKAEIAKKASDARWAKRRARETPVLEGLPRATHSGVLELVGGEIPCYVLSDGQRVIGRTQFTTALTNIKGGGDLEKYLSVPSLKPHINIEDVAARMVPFRIPEVEGLERDVKGLSSSLMIDICHGFVRALEAQPHVTEPTLKMTARQTEIALKAAMLLAACAKTGLDALIDEATGYQFQRAEDALRLKLKVYLEEEMRKWEPTFPNELWVEFGRLTKWKGTVTKRPKYWGKLVMELVYEYLDRDVARWLKEHAPPPRHGQNYHQWLSGQYGLKKLVEHIWTLIGVARTCQSMHELRERMAELNGRRLEQFYLPLPNVPRLPPA